MVETATETSCKSRTSSPAMDEPPRKDMDPKNTNLQKDDYMDFEDDINDLVRSMPIRRAEDRPQTEIVWIPNALGFLALYVASLYTIYLFFFDSKWPTKAWMILLMAFAGLVTTMGSHRLFTHRSYKAVPGLRAFLVFSQVLTAQNCLWVWVRDHRQHHKYSDTDADPHNASRGFFFSHVGWLMVRKHPDVIAKGKLVDMSDMNADPLVMFQKKYYKSLFTLLAVIIPTAIPYYLWGEDLMTSFMMSSLGRIHITNNLVWLVNSWAHIIGTRPYSGSILPSESFFVAVVALGEGWHNFHHTFPWDYRTAEAGKWPNLTTTLIDFCARRGWVHDRKAVTTEMLINRVVKRGDHTHPLFGDKTEDIVDKVNEVKLAKEVTEQQVEEDMKLVGRLSGDARSKA
ncbi:acyl-CoA Delta-9 desaturase isoform X2 [Bemisia tabaci]|uniref:acyl-CoA Delta-9 desaturase isoform X2 n=1 Tax=Bemisia tabaci TaxID=7038 RepID=UPI003B27F279